jgi:hypothetical protein
VAVWELASARQGSAFGDDCIISSPVEYGNSMVGICKCAWSAGVQDATITIGGKRSSVDGEMMALICHDTIC